MAFWGVEVKPGKPFTHEFDPLKGRLHISMATLGFGTATAKSILQCNVGNRSPVYLCSLYPGNSESLQLNLELEEFDEFIFSVIGPRSIHLCGYYLPSGRNSNINEDTESHGEDIADTETERSDYSDEDEYDDSFIDDDGDPKVFTPSSVSCEEEASNDKRPKGRKSRLRRLRRKYQSMDSDDDGCFEENNIVNGSMHDQSNEIDNEDSLPISSLCKNKAFGRVLDQEMDDIGEGVAGDASNKNGEDGSNSIIDPNLKTEIVLADSQTHREAELSDHLVHPCSVLDVGNVKKVRNKKKGKPKETKNSCIGQSIELDNAMQDELKMDKITHVLQTGNDQYEEHGDDKCQLIELVEESNIVNDSMHNQPKEIVHEDSLPISSLCKNKASAGVLDQAMDDIGDGGAGDASNKNGEDGGNSIIDPNLKPDTFLTNSQTHREAELSDHLVHPFTVLDVGNVKKFKKKKKGKQKETKSSCNGQSIELDNAMQDELKMDKITSVLQTGNDQSQEHGDDKCQSIELVEESNIVNESMHNQPKEIDNEDSRPISSLWKNKASGGVLYQEKDDIGDGAAGDASNKNGEDGGKSIIDPKLKTDVVLADSQTHREAELSDHLVRPCTVLDVGNVKKVKNKKGKPKETKSSCNGQSIELDSAMQDELKMDKITHVLQTGNDQYQEHGDDECQSIQLVEESNIVSDSMPIQPKAIDIEDSLPISSLCKNKAFGRVLDQEMDDLGEGVAVDATNKNGEDGSNSIIDPNLKTEIVLVDSQTHREAELSDHLVHPCTVLDVGNVNKVKNKKKAKQKETKNSYNGQSIELDNAMHDELKMDKITHVLQTGNDQYEEHGDDKCQSIELVEESNIVSGSIINQPKALDNEDGLPISSLYKNKSSAGVLDQEIDDIGDGGAGDASNKNGEDGGNSIIDPNLKTDTVLANSQTLREAELSDHLVHPCTVLDVGNVKKVKNKKGKQKETKSSCNGQSIKLDNTIQDELKMDKITHVLQTGNVQYQEHGDDKCQSIELVEENNIVNDSMHDQPKEIVHEDSLPISSLCKNKASAGVLDQEMDDNGNGGTGDAIYKNGEDGGNSIIDPNLKTGIVLADSQTHGEAEFSDHLVGPCTVLDVDNVQKFEKKKKGKEKEAKSSSNGPSIKLDNTMQDEPKMDKMAWDLRPANEQSHDNVDDNRGTETMDKKKILPSCEIGHGQGEKPKKKRKERSKEGIDLVANADYHSNLVNLHQRNEQNEQHIINEDVEISSNVALPSNEMDPEKRRKKRKKKEQVNKGPHIVGDNAYHKDITKEIVQRDELEFDNMIHKFPEGKEQNQKLKFQKRVDDGAHDFPDGNQSDDRKAKRKKKSKSRGNVEVLSSELPQLSVEQSSGMVREDVNKSAEAIPSQVRKLSNGLVIEELEMGKKGGKIAASGRKISIHYIGKLMENGVVFESNAGQAPFKFRLGKGEVIKGWDVGLEGMRVGEKRRLVIPPSMASKSEGHSANIPPNSWLVYDFELVKVH